MAGRKPSKRDRTRSAGRRKGSGETRRGRLRREFNPDYSYVKKDLRRIGLLTGVFLTLLIVLSFIIQ